MKSFFVFDKDGTLSNPSSPILPSHAEFLAQFLAENTVTLLTARNLECCQHDLIDPLLAATKHVNLKNLTLACSNGAEIYALQEAEYKKVSTDKNAIDLQKGNNFDLPSACEKILPIVQEYFPEASIELRGDYFIAIPCISRNSSQEARKRCDPTTEKRYTIIEKIRSYFPEFFEILPGGQTSIDIAIINKEYGMKHVMKYFKIENVESVHYFGDAFDGGNDEPVKSIKGIHIHEVSSPDDTFAYLKNL